MANMSPEKQPMQLLDPELRSTTFDEVSLGYTESEALNEADRCLNCKNKPCVSGCPVNIDIPAFIAQIKEKNYENAYQKITEASSLPAVCGRVCPQERQCESKCVRGIKGDAVGIGRLERFVADYHNFNNSDNTDKIKFNGHKVAVIGSGPAGLSCAGELCKKGYEVTVFEALHVAGGVLVYGIPEFRLPKKTVQKEIDTLKKMGVKVETNIIIGKTFTIEELMNEHGIEAIFIGSGAGLPKFMSIPGENLKGVYSANEFLTRINLMKAYKDDSNTPIAHPRKTIVVGGGNVAMDAARCARRMGSEVYIAYRRTKSELPARKEEVEHAIEEGIKFEFLVNPISINSGEDKSVASITCQRMELSAPDSTGRAKPTPIENSEFNIEADTVIMALGTSPNPLIKSTTNGLETQNWGGIIVDENGQTSIPGVFAGGDAVIGAATVILAMGAGKSAANAIDKYINTK